MIDTHNGYGDVPPVNVDNYIAIKRHLDQFYPKLEKRQDKGVTPYNLRNCAYHAEFLRDKIVYSEIVQHPQFFLDTQGQYYLEATSFLITGRNRLKFLVGVFNSTAFTFFFKNYYAGGGLGRAGYRYKKAFLEKAPVPSITKRSYDLVQQIEKLVESIQRKPAKLQFTSRDSSNKINELIYQLYKLNDDEIALIENSHLKARCQ